MKGKAYNEFLLRTKDKKLLRFLYKDNIGIYIENIINNKIIKNNTVYKDSLKYFYVTEDYNGYINLIYQDMTGKIVLCILRADNWIYRTLFYIKHSLITPINIKGFFLKNDFKLIYNLDSDSNKIYFSKSGNDKSKIIYSEKNDIDINYNILNGEDYVSLIIYSISFNMFKLILKTYNVENESWSSNKIIFINNNPYTDMSFCITNNKVHSFIIIDEDKKKALIYKYINLDKNEYIQKELIIYRGEDISSCLIMELDKVIWALWISNNKLYGCYSMDNGENFSKPLGYLDIKEESVRKITFIENGKSKEIYINENNGNITLFLEELLKYNTPFDINYKEITYSFKDKKENSSVNQEIKKIKEIVNNQKSQILSLEYKLKK